MKFSPPPGCSGDYYRAIDFDVPELSEGRTERTDLSWYCLGADHKGVIRQSAATHFGDAPEGQVTAETCQDAARTTSHSEVDVSTISTNKTSWCLITESQQIAWIRVTGKGAPFGAAEYRQPTLTLKVTLWPSP